VVAPEAAALAFGDEWRESGQWFRLLVPWFVASLSFGPIAQVWLLLGRQRDALAWHAVVLGASVAALAVGARTMEPAGAILLFAGVGAVARLFVIEVTFRAAGAKAGASLNVLARELVRAVPFVLLVWGVRAVQENVWATAGAAVVAIGAHLALIVRRRGRA
ncbi:MAG: hypothetical protein KC591_12925, partial [Gemmatimonadetes bacterium]|nr:hypothetical protein [Gemmatimonadota bacterium]